MNFFKQLFEKKPKLHTLQISSMEINRALFDLIVKTEKILDELKAFLDDGNVSLKEAKLAELENALINMKSKIDSLRLDVQRVLDIELKHKDYILLNDDFYLRDKLYRVDTMSQVIEELIDLIGEKPAVNELKEMMNYIYGRMNTLVDSVNNIASDDKRLEEVYSRLGDL